MKKTALIFIASFGIFFTSCKKEYTCECTTTSLNSTVNGVPQQTGSAKKVSIRGISKTSKKNAKAICGNSTDTYTNTYYDSQSGTSYNSTSTETTKCKLK